MTVSIRKESGGYEVRTPTQVHAKHTTLKRALRQRNLLNALEHNPGWNPREKP